MLSHSTFTATVFFLKLIFAFDMDANSHSIESVPCILKLCEKYFLSKRLMKGSLVIINFPEDESILTTYIIKAFNDDKKHKQTVMTKIAIRKHGNPIHVTEKAQNYFIICRNSTDLIQNINQLKNLPTWNPLAQVVVLVDDLTMSESETNEFIDTIFKETFQNYLLNVNVIYKNLQTNNILAVTWYPYEGTNCAHKVQNIRIIDECVIIRDSIEEKEHVHVTEYNLGLGPKIPDNFHYCPIKITATNWSPFTEYHSSVGFYSGVEFFMMKALGDLIQIRPVFYLSNNSNTDSDKDYFWDELLKRYNACL